MKLLNKSISLYILYASVLLLIAIPVLYFSIQHRVVHEMDETLQEQKDKIINDLKKTDAVSLAPWLENIEPGITLLPSVTENNKPDRFYTTFIIEKISNEKSPYRVLETTLNLKGKPYTLQIKNSFIGSQDLIESIVRIVGILLLLVIVGLVLINQVLSKKLWKPFYNLLDKLQEFKIENNAPLHFEKTTTTEFKALNQAITLLTGRSREVYQSQKEFTENASHEMQTPLAIFQGKLDLLMQTMPLTEEQSELISDLADVNQRINRLNKSLLLLTKIENNQFAEIENVSIQQLLIKLIEQYSFQLEQRNITIINEITEDIVVVANKMLIEIMLGNLLSNAIKHNFINGSIVIRGNKTEITFMNSGTATVLNEDKIFQRFQKQTTDSSSIGLGLQIAQKIATNYQYIINYSFHNEQHQFRLRFS